MTRIEEIEKLPINRFIDEVNWFTQDEAKRCRILLARVLKELDKNNRNILTYKGEEDD